MVIPTIDSELLVLSTSREYFKSFGVNLIISEVSLVKACRNKKQLIKIQRYTMRGGRGEMDKRTRIIRMGKVHRTAQGIRNSRVMRMEVGEPKHIHIAGGTHRRHTRVD